MRGFKVASIAAFCLALAFGFGNVACTRDGARAPKEDPVSNVLTFDPSVADFYWYGHKLESPVTLTLARGEFRANGIPAVAFRYDTSGSSARLAPRFGRIPFIDSLVKRGSSYIEALNTFGSMAVRQPRLCIQAYRLHQAEGDSSARAWALGMLTPGLCDPAEPIEVDANRFSCRLADGNPIHIEVPPGVSVEDPPPPDSLLIASQIVEGWRVVFAGHRNVVVIATMGGSASFWGASADRARREIANARAAYQRGGIAALEEVASTSFVTRHSLEQIARTEPGTPR